MKKETMLRTVAWQWRQTAKKAGFGLKVYVTLGVAIWAILI